MRRPHGSMEGGLTGGVSQKSTLVVGPTSGPRNHSNVKGFVCSSAQLVHQSQEMKARQPSQQKRAKRKRASRITMLYWTAATHRPVSCGASALATSLSRGRGGRGEGLVFQPSASVPCVCVDPAQRGPHEKREGQLLTYIPSSPRTECATAAGRARRAQRRREGAQRTRRTGCVGVVLPHHHSPCREVTQGPRSVRAVATFPHRPAQTRHSP